MAKGRMIESDIWEDDFFNSLSIFERLLWVGIITGAADDQGRFQDNNAIIRSKVFPTEDILLSQVETALNRYSTANKITRYIVGGKHLIQINNWWKHQTPRWASQSNYPAPAGWVDRIRCHTTGNAILEENWNSKGGYIANYTEPKTINDVKGDVKGDDDVEGTAAATSPFSHLSALVASKIRMNEFTGGPERWSAAIQQMLDAGVEECDLDSAIDYMADKVIAGPWSIVNPVIIAKGRRDRGDNGNGRKKSHRRGMEGLV